MEDNDKHLLMNAFNDHFFEFIEDIESVFSTDASIKRVKNALVLIKKMNPSIITKIWYKYIVLPLDKIFPFCVQNGHRLQVVLSKLALVNCSFPINL